MSKFKYIYAPLTTVKLQHENGLLAQNYVKIYPSTASAELINQYKLVVKITPEGFVILYKKQEEFEAQTVDEIIIIDNKEVIDKRIIGYVSTMPNPTYTNWLPETIDVDLEFYVIANQHYRENTDWNNLALNDFVVYNEIDSEGIITTNTEITEKRQPDAILQINIKETNINTPRTLTFEIGLTS